MVAMMEVSSAVMPERGLWYDEEEVVEVEVEVGSGDRISSSPKISPAGSTMLAPSQIAWHKWP
jgi:hypothetical protein